MKKVLGSEPKYSGNCAPKRFVPITAKTKYTIKSNTKIHPMLGIACNSDSIISFSLGIFLRSLSVLKILNALKTANDPAAGRILITTTTPSKMFQGSLKKSSLKAYILSTSSITKSTKMIKSTRSIM